MFHQNAIERIVNKRLFVIHLDISHFGHDGLDPFYLYPTDKKYIKLIYKFNKKIIDNIHYAKIEFKQHPLYQHFFIKMLLKK